MEAILQHCSTRAQVALLPPPLLSVEELMPSLSSTPSRQELGAVGFFLVPNWNFQGLPGSTFGAEFCSHGVPNMHSGRLCAHL